MTFKEKIVKPIEEKGIIKTYEEYDDFLDGPKIKVYSLDEVAIEKVCALFSPARNEPRDLYDIYHLIENERLDIASLIHCIEDKMKFKGSSFDKNRNKAAHRFV